MNDSTLIWDLRKQICSFSSFWLHVQSLPVVGPLSKAVETSLFCWRKTCTYLINNCVRAHWNYEEGYRDTQRRQRDTGLWGLGAAPLHFLLAVILHSIVAKIVLCILVFCFTDIDLTQALNPESMIPILANSEVQERLVKFLPDGESLPKTEQELRNTVQSPQFQQVWM